MSLEDIFTLTGQVTAVLVPLVAGWWAFEKWRKRDEHFPRISFEVSVNFVGHKDGHLVCELVAVLENKGVVPLRIRDFTFVLRGLKKSDALLRGGPDIRHQTIFPHKIDEGRFVPEDWQYSFIYPDVKTEYNFVNTIPDDTMFVRLQGDFAYQIGGGTHRAAKVLKVPKSCPDGPNS